MENISMAVVKNPRNLHQFFEYHADIHPNHIALNCQGELVTYKELEHRANQWANFLIEKGIRPGHKIAMFLECTVDLYVIMLGILKAGAAYIPIDMHTPVERIDYILENSQTYTMISSSRLTQQMSNVSTRMLLINELEDQIQKQPNTRPSNQQTNLKEDDLCYVIYTSGTTGKPKGVGIAHSSICHYVKTTQDIYQPTEQDRVYQGFSIAFDASLEEIWLAFASGATLVVGASDAVHSGAALAEFLNFHQVTILSTVPTMLVIIGEQIPSLRLLILGGEVCTLDLIKQWSRPGLRILNTYGPTEATVITTYTECDPEKPVTIGRPIQGSEIFILDEQLNLTKPNVPGQLCIGGPGLAKEYVNNAELTDKKFVANPHKPGTKIYLSGDLASWTEDGNIQFLGRIDEQIKLRGFRIELPEIEATLIKHPSVRAAAVAVKELTSGVQTLVAYLIPEKNYVIDIEQITKFLRINLPDYMIPGAFDILTELPLLQSGKIDRKNLPNPQYQPNNHQENYIPPTTKVQEKIAQAWQEMFNHSQISITADFFYDLGGHSLLASTLVSKLRKEKGWESLSMLDVYNYPTIEKFAKNIEDNLLQKAPASILNHNDLNNSKEKESHKQSFIFCGFAQSLFTYFLYTFSTAEFILILFFMDLAMNKITFYSAESIAIILSIIFIFPVALFGISIMAKWLLLGKIKPGQYKLWGWFYFRWWAVQKIQSLLPLDHLVGSPLINLYYRLMGVKIGKNSFIASSEIHSFDTLTIGDNSSIGYESILSGYIVENGWLKIGTIDIGNRCFIGTRTILCNNTKMEDDSSLDDLSMLPEHMTIPKNQKFAGSPARFLESQSNNEVDVSIKESKFHYIKYGALHCLALLFISLIFYISFIPALLLINYFINNNVMLALLIGAPIGAVSIHFLYCLLVIVITRFLLRNLREGTYKVQSTTYVKRWLISLLLNNPIINTMPDSVYLPMFLRLLGANIQKNVEIGGLSHAQPDLLYMQDESFSGGSALLAVPKIHLGHATYSSALIGKRTFIGNFSVIPGGYEIGDNGLIGSLSIPPKNGSAKLPSTAWLGSPAIFLPKRQNHSGYCEELTFNPTKSLYVKRLIIELIRITSPTLFNLFTLIGVIYTIDYLLANYNIFSAIILFPLFEMIILLANTSTIILLKWMLLGRIKECVKPLWTPFIWKLDIIETLTISYLWPNIFQQLLGTPFLAFFLRLLGMKIGKRVFIDTETFAEADMIDIGNDVAINKHAIIQTHLFEDRLFKIGRIKISDGCNLGIYSLLLYNTIMEKNSYLGNLSLLMKGEILPADTHWEGLPAQHISHYNLSYQVNPNTAFTEAVINPLGKTDPQIIG